MKNLIYPIAILACLAIFALDVDAQCLSCLRGGGAGGCSDGNCGTELLPGGSGVQDNADANGIGTCTNQGRPCANNAEFTNGNWNAPCPSLSVEAYQKKIARAWAASRDQYTPYPLYTYGKTGIDAARIDQWNRVRAQQTPWHGGYNYHRFNAPTALVVPPTAAFQTSYSWGVGGTRSLPINHQFGTAAPGGSFGISQQFLSRPHWPSSTDQLGVYPVRAPWSHIR